MEQDRVYDTMVEPERTPEDPDEQSLDCTLDSFLSEWRCELHRPREKEANGGHLLGKRERAEHVPVSQQDSPEDLPGAAASRKRAVPIQEPSPLLVLPPPGGGGGERAVAKVLITASGVQRSGSASDAVGTRLVDRLIADLVRNSISGLCCCSYITNICTVPYLEGESVHTCSIGPLQLHHFHIISRTSSIPVRIAVAILEGIVYVVSAVLISVR